MANAQPMAHRARALWSGTLLPGYQQDAVPTTTASALGPCRRVQTCAWCQGGTCVQATTRTATGNPIPVHMVTMTTWCDQGVRRVDGGLKALLSRRPHQHASHLGHTRSPSWGRQGQGAHGKPSQQVLPHGCGAGEVGLVRCGNWSELPVFELDHVDRPLTAPACRLPTSSVAGCLCRMQHGMYLLVDGVCAGRVGLQRVPWCHLQSRRGGGLCGGVFVVMETRRHTGPPPHRPPACS